jgi:hypothetical protein
MDSEVKPSCFTEQESRRLRRRLFQFLSVASLNLCLFGVFCQWVGHGSNGWGMNQEAAPYRLVLVTQIPWDSEAQENPHTLSEHLNRCTRESKVEIVRQAQWWAFSDLGEFRTLTTRWNSFTEMQAAIWNLGGDKVAEDLDAFCFSEFTADILSDENSQSIFSEPRNAQTSASGGIKPASFVLSLSKFRKRQIIQSGAPSISLPVKTVYGVSELISDEPRLRLSIPASLGLATTVLIIASSFGLFCRHLEDCS